MNVMKRKILNESDIEKAELLIAAEAAFEKLSGIVEDYGDWIIKTYFPIIDEIRKTIGDKIADKWTNMTKEQIEKTLDELNKTKEIFLNATTKLDKIIKGKEVSFEISKQPDDLSLLKPSPNKGENKTMYRKRISEKWNVEGPVVDPEDVGKWKDYSIKELCALWKKLRKKENKTPADKEKIAQIVFAIRAKYYGRGKKWGPAKTVCGIKESNLMEKWGKRVEIDPGERGKWSKYTVRELCQRYKRIKNKKHHTAKDTETLRELAFAIRAKMGWPKGKGPLTICGLEID